MFNTNSALVLAAAIAIFRTDAWDAQGSCKDCACDVTSDGTATRWESDLAKTANSLLWSTNPKEGLLVRVHDGMESSLLPASHVNAAQRPPNPMYQMPLRDSSKSQISPLCPYAGSDCENAYENQDLVDHCNSLDYPNGWELANVGLMYGTKYMNNKDRDEFNSFETTTHAYANICYPTDSNAMDENGRNWQSDVPDQGVDAKGCHASQNFGCDADGNCVADKDTACKCNFDNIGGASNFVSHIVEGSLKNPDNTYGWAAKGQDEYAICRNKDTGEYKQPQYVMADYASCWIEPDNFDNLMDVQNALWRQRDDWNNWKIPARQPFDTSYWGWTECPAQFGIKNDRQDQEDAADAVLIILPAMQNNGPDYAMSTCDISDSALNLLEESLNVMYDSGFGGLPHLIMEQTSGMSPDDCAKYWGDENCDDGYRKGVFTQNFLFPGGSCLMVDETRNSEVYFYKSGDQVCIDYQNAVSSKALRLLTQSSN